MWMCGHMPRGVHSCIVHVLGHKPRSKMHKACWEWGCRGGARGVNCHQGEADPNPHPTFLPEKSHSHSRNGMGSRISSPRCFSFGQWQIGGSAALKWTRNAIPTSRQKGRAERITGPGVTTCLTASKGT